MEMYAHISEKDGRRQTILEHANGTSEIAAEFAKDFILSNEAAYVGKMHDIGKYSMEFQHRLNGGPKVDHSTAGAYEAFKSKKLVEAFCISGHHSGLPDGGNRSEIEGSTFWARINRAMNNEIPNYDGWIDEIKCSEYQSELSSNNLQVSFLIRMLFSCLVDADYLDTERFMHGNICRGVKFDPNKLENDLNNYIKKWFPPKGDLNKLRCDILSNIIQMATNEGKGIYTFTVPTGGGKTISSLSFAINHAKHYGMRRIIYVIPYTSIIEQTADIFRKILGNENVLEHHSHSLQFEEDDSGLYARATENWDMPIIVTTAVQFFESIYKNKPSMERKLHNIANSVIVFDEAQMLPLPYLKPCVLCISELVKRYGVTAVLCTATQPSLNNIFNEFVQEITIKELCPQEIYDNNIFKRVEYKNIGLINIDEIVGQINSQFQALCIVNSKKAAIDIYDKIDSDNTFHLSTSMYPLHRIKVLDEIRYRLLNNLPCKVISTSLIEVGVDVDFPVVFRQVCGLDSIVQAAGRCNREGKKKSTDSKVFVFDLECGSPEIFASQIAAYKIIIEKYGDDISNKNAINDYFNNLYYFKGKDELDHYGIIDLLEKGNMPFQTISDRFNVINNNTRTIYIETPDIMTEIECLKKGYANYKDYRKLGLYGVNVYDYQFNKLIDDHSIIRLSDGNGILLDKTLYSDEKGLDLTRESGQGIFL